MMLNIYTQIVDFRDWEKTVCRIPSESIIDLRDCRKNKLLSTKKYPEAKNSKVVFSDRFWRKFRKNNWFCVHFVDFFVKNRSDIDQNEVDVEVEDVEVAEEEITDVFMAVRKVHI